MLELRYGPQVSGGPEPGAMGRPPGARAAQASATATSTTTRLPYVEMPEFMSSLRAVDGVAERALELLCLTAMRTAEVRLAQVGRSSTRTARRGRCQRRSMKKSTADHRVPLSDRAVADTARPAPARRLGVPGSGSGQADRLCRRCCAKLSSRFAPTAPCTDFGRRSGTGLPRDHGLSKSRGRDGIGSHDWYVGGESVSARRTCWRSGSGSCRSGPPTAAGLL